MLVKEQPAQIGAVAKTTGVPIKTIRYYEEIGLLQASDRTEGGFRLFDPTIFSRLRFIKRAQQMGLSLAEIKKLLEVHDQGDLPCEHVKVKLVEKITEIDQQIQQLRLLQEQLKGLLTHQGDFDSESIICPILERK